MARFFRGPLAALALIVLAGGPRSAAALPVIQPALTADYFGADAPFYRSTLLGADLDGDGRVDLVTVPHTVYDFMSPQTPLLARADGGFDPRPAVLPPGDEFFDAQLRDVNGDGRLDLVETIRDTPNSTGHVWMSPGDGAGNFGAPVVLASDPLWPTTIDFADFDGDGKPDLLFTTYYSSPFKILRGLGNGTFVPFAVGPSPVGFYSRAVDLDGDGRPEVVAISGSNLVIYQVPPSGGPIGSPVTVSFPGYALKMLVQDLDGDGLPDVVLAGSEGLLRFHNLGGLAFQALAPVTGYKFADLTNADIRFGDLDGDGVADLVIPLGTGLQYLHDFGVGAVEPAVQVDSGAPSTGYWLTDVDGDGKTDVYFLTQPTGGTAQLELHLSGGVPGGHATAVGAAPSAVVSADVDRDGRADLVTVNTSANSVSVLYGNGAGGFDTRVDLPVGRHPVGVAAAPLATGGLVDLVVTDLSDNDVSVLRGVGGRAFAPAVTYPVGSQPHGVAVGDVTGDGIPDIVVTNEVSATLSVLPGDGAGGFGPRSDVSTGPGPESLALVDWDGDGHLDFVYALRSASQVVLRLAGPGGLGPELLGPLVLHPTGIAVGDLDGDGRPDVVAVSADQSTVGIGRNDGAGGFLPTLFVPAGVSAAGVAIGDFDADGRPDLAVAHGIGGYPGQTPRSYVSVLSGTAAHGFATPVNFGVGLAAAGLAAGDFNGDSRVDLASADEGSSTVTVLLNAATGPLVGVPTAPAHAGAALAIAHLAPNPSRGAFAAELALAAPGPAVAKVVSLAGRTLWTRTLAAPARAQRLAVDAALSPGVYWLDVTQGGLRAARKFVVLP